ncbi:unnamed protein product [Echinostoma caproni]|uniref:Uncharacterized protein n=1 Tax=Echinostoma caproni TaxID=27848 RepID=A0A183A7Q4_9TREM|nr:unnamed protein product [Echinostoma caproni]
MREGKDTIWASRIHAELKFYQYVNEKLFPLYNVSFRPSGKSLREFLVRIYRRQIQPGPIFIGLDHNVPRGLIGLRFVHLTLIVTPIYICHDRDILVNQHQSDLSPTSETDNKADLEERYFACHSQSENNQTLNSTWSTLLCIPSELMCDSYPNCPRDAHKRIPDEYATQCFHVTPSTNQRWTWIIPMIGLPIVVLSIALLTWFCQTRQCQRCRDLWHKRALPNSPDRAGSAANCSDCMPLPSALEEEFLLNYSSRLTTGHGDPTQAYAPPPPSYHEATGILLPDYPIAVFLPAPVHSLTPSSNYPISGSDSLFDSFGEKCPRSLVPPHSGGLNRIAQTMPQKPPSYQQCIRPESNGAHLNGGLSSDRKKRRIV